MRSRLAERTHWNVLSCRCRDFRPTLPLSGRCCPADEPSARPSAATLRRMKHVDVRADAQLDDLVPAPISLEVDRDGLDRPGFWPSCKVRLKSGPESFVPCLEGSGRQGLAAGTIGARWRGHNWCPKSSGLLPN